MIVKKNEKMEEIAVRGVTCNKAEAKITICAVPDQTGIAAKIFTDISKMAVNVDMIVQNVSHTKLTDISFTVSKSDLPKAIQAAKAVAQKIRAGEVLLIKALHAFQSSVPECVPITVSRQRCSRCWRRTRSIST